MAKVKMRKTRAAVKIQSKHALARRLRSGLLSHPDRMAALKRRKKLNDPAEKKLPLLEVLD